MANSYFTPTGNPVSNASGSSSTMRTQFANIALAFDKLPLLTAGSTVVVNASATALVTSTDPLSTSGSDFANPTLTFATPGNLSVVYSGRQIFWARMGPMIFVSFIIETSTFTHTTASGTMKLTGLPLAPVGAVTEVYMGGVVMTGFTTTKTQVYAYIDNVNEIKFASSGNNILEEFLTAAHAPTAVQKRIDGSLYYRVSA